MPAVLLSILISLVAPVAVWQLPRQLLLPHPHVTKVQVSPYDEAAAKAGFSQWGSITENAGRAHAALRLEPKRATLGVAVDSSLGAKKIEKWASGMAADLTWQVVDLKIVPQGKTTFVLMSASTPVAPRLPGQYRATLSLRVLQRAVSRVVEGPLPLAVYVPHQGEARPLITPTARYQEKSDHYLFYVLDPGEERSLVVDYGIADGGLVFFGLSLGLWLALPFAAALAARALARSGSPEQQAARFARLTWALSLAALGVTVAVTLLPAGEIASYMLPERFQRNLWSLAAVPVLVPLFLTAVAVEVVGYRLYEPERADPWRHALARPLVFAGVAVGTALGLAAALLTWDRALWVGPAVAAVPIGLALLNYAWGRVESAEAAAELETPAGAGGEHRS